MTIKAKFLLVASSAMVAVLLVSEWLTLREVARFLETHQHEMEGLGGLAAAATLEEGARALLARVVWIHFGLALVSLAALALALHIVWRFWVRRRLDALAARIAKMERGTWDLEDAGGADEIAALERRIAQLGKTVTATAEQFGDVSKLAALALLGHSIERDVASAAARLRAVREELRQTPGGGGDRFRRILPEIQASLASLERVPARLRKQFEQEFRKHVAAAGGTSNGPAGRPLHLLRDGTGSPRATLHGERENEHQGEQP